VEPTLIDTGPGAEPLRILERDFTPASRLVLQGLGAARGLLRGSGIDWGSGCGCLAIRAARIEAVDHVVGLELDPASIQLARENAVLNGVAGKVTFVRSDSFEPLRGEPRDRLDALRGRANFLLANPPASRGDDGLGWRRAILAGARDYLSPGAPLLLQISFQYGARRIEALTRDVPGTTYEGVVDETDWVPFDQERPDLARQLEEYASEEGRGGLPYTFEGSVTAAEALRRYREGGASPRSRWQLHLFRA
jgi:hypothetical protein